MYFDSFNKINYPVDVNGNTIMKTIVDITTNVRLSQEMIDQTVNYNYSTLTDGETPEITAYEAYDDPYQHHLVILANDRFDHRESYPLTSSEFDSYVNEKYSNPYGIHHYEDINGNIVDNLYNDNQDNDVVYPKNIIPITNIEYETRINEEKRRIRTIKPQLVSTVNQLIDDTINANS